jgi:hypothetical protein
MATPKFAGQRFLRGTDRSRLGNQASRRSKSASTPAEQARRINGSFCIVAEAISSRRVHLETRYKRLADSLALLLRLVELGSVAGLLDGGDELLRINLALLDFNDGFVGMGNLSADNARNFFECRPHSFGTVDRSGHAGDFEAHGFVDLLGLGCLRVG